MEGGPKSLNRGRNGAAAPGTEPEGEGTLPAATGARLGGQCGAGAPCTPPWAFEAPRDPCYRIGPGPSGRKDASRQPGCPTPGANPTPPRPLTAQPGKLRLDQGRRQASGLQNSDPGGTPAQPGQMSIGAESEPHLSGPGSRALGCWSRGCCWGRGRWVCRTSPTPGCGGRRPAAPPGLAAWPPSRALIGRRRARPL